MLKRIVVTAIVVIVGLSTPVLAQSSLQVIAAQKLKSGGLAQWEKQWYKQIVAGKHCPQAKVFATCYGPFNGYGGDDYHIAANPGNLPRGTVVYVELTGKLMVCTNRGADFNDRIARRKGCGYWIDVWCRRPGMYGLGSKTTRLWVVGFDKAWVKH